MGCISRQPNGAISTEEAISYAKVCEDCGYDAVSSVAPFYFKFSFEEIKNHYFSIAESISLPMFVYNIPAFSGVTLSVDNISEFLKSDKFAGVKYTSSDFFGMERIKTRHPDKIVYNGYDEMFLSELSMGADGGIGSTYNFMAEKFVKIKDCFAAGDLKTAYEVQKEVNAVVEALMKVGVLAGVKEALRQTGIDVGVLRAPFAPLDKKQQEYVAKNIIPYLS